MQFEKDYIIRQVKLFAEFLMQVLSLKRQGRNEEAHEKIQQSLNELCESTEKEFHELTVDEMFDALKYNGNFNAELAIIVADLLYEEREFLEGKDRERCSKKALKIYQKVKEFPDVAFPIEAIQKITQLNTELDGDVT